jgi:hypothetical protein
MLGKRNIESTKMSDDDDNKIEVDEGVKDTQTSARVPTKKAGFQPGNKLGRGNPHAKAVHDFRAVALSMTTREDMKAVWRGLVKQARAGKQWAVCEFLDRVLGKAIQSLDVTVDAQATINALVMDDSTDRESAIAALIASRALVSEVPAPMPIISTVISNPAPMLTDESAK